MMRVSVLHSSVAIATFLACIVFDGAEAFSSVTPKLPQQISINQKELEEVQFPRCWVPIASSFELDPSRPSALQFLGMSYVAYFNEAADRWCVLDDACPHRLAPLSEGRIDPETKSTLECSYHGWEFDADGKCQTIPQADEVTLGSVLKTNPRCNVKSYPAHVEKNILFFWPWKDDVLGCDPEFTPEATMSEFRPGLSTYTRDLPYGWDTLIENIVDPSHVPFAHHGLQGKRTDAIPVNMTAPTSLTPHGFSFEFGDRTMAKVRKGTGAFKAPFIIDYNAEFEQPPDYKKKKPVSPFNLTAIMMPTKPGWSRIMIFGVETDPDKETRKKETIPYKIYRKLPVWLTHTLNNKFLDSDLYFLHYQEQERKRRDPGEQDLTNAYFMPLQADRSVSAIRRWVKRYAHIPSTLPPPITDRGALFNRWQQHGDKCVHCTKAKKSIETWRKRTRRLLYVSILLGAKYSASRVGIVACLAVLNRLGAVEKSLMEGGFNHYENH